jgi:hypothetical protein
MAGSNHEMPGLGVHRRGGKAQHGAQGSKAFLRQLAAGVKGFAGTAGGRNINNIHIASESLRVVKKILPSLPVS